MVDGEAEEVRTIGKLTMWETGGKDRPAPSADTACRTAARGVARRESPRWATATAAESISVAWLSPAPANCEQGFVCKMCSE